MKNVIVLNVIIFLSLIFPASLSCQEDFVIGIFGIRAKNLPDDFVGGVPNISIFEGYNTSHFNILKEDGFNIVTGYKPDVYSNLDRMKSWLELSEANDLKFMVATNDWYKPNEDDFFWGLGYDSDGEEISVKIANSNDGVNVYGSPYGERPNYDEYFEEIYIQPEYSDIIWGHQIVEESALFNTRVYNNEALGWDGPNRMETEVPLVKLLDAFSYFNSTLVASDITNQKFIVMEANHFGTINDYLIYDEENNLEFSHYTAKHTLNAIPQNTVFFEGSYNYFSSNWYDHRHENITYSGMPGDGNFTRHYLGTFESVSYAKSRVNEVVDVLGIYYPEGGDYIFHSKITKPNANWLWFRAYTSIIHGADGIWFWGFQGLYPGGSFNNSGIAEDVDAFERENFPVDYNNYIAPLTRELRYLADQGFLKYGSDDNVLYRKLGHVDNHCIVPPARDYIPKHKDLPESLKDAISASNWSSEFRGSETAEFYGLRYTIRTNGEDVIMIISNPLDIEINDIVLDFSEISNEVIQNATGVDVLFNDGTSIISPIYKVDRDSGVDLDAGTLTDIDYLPISGAKTLELDFGPLDVHVLRFVGPDLPDYDNGWELVWSNYGSGRIGDWGDINEEDKFYPGDFNGDGEDELLVVQSYDDPTYTWMTMLKYNNLEDTWDVLWSNSGALHMLLPYREYLQVGDFDGDGKDECLGNIPFDLTSPLYIFEFTGTDWTISWTGGTDHPMYPYKNKLIVGDFNGDTRDELLGWDIDGSDWKTMFRFNDTDWLWYWSDGGAGSPISLYLLKTYVADYNADGQDELLGILDFPYPIMDGDAILFQFDAFNWYNLWSTEGGTSFGGWTYPIPENDQVLVGNTDYVDPKDEILFISRGELASWAASMDLNNNADGWSWNWSANPEYSVPYIDDWPLADGPQGSNTGYFLMKPYEFGPNYLMALRKFGCQTGYKYYVSMYRSQSSSNKMPEEVINFEEIIDQTSIGEDSYLFSVFPNPSSEFFFVNFHLNSQEAVALEMYDMNGKIVLRKQLNELSSGNHRITIETDNLDKGVYLLNFVGKRGVTTKKIIIQN